MSTSERAKSLSQLADDLRQMSGESESQELREWIEGIADDLEKLDELVKSGVASRLTYELQRDIPRFVRYRLDPIRDLNQTYRGPQGQLLNRGRMHRPWVCDLHTRELVTEPIDPFDQYSDFEKKLSHVCQCILSALEPTETPTAIATAQAVENQQVNLDAGKGDKKEEQAVVLKKAEPDGPEGLCRDLGDPEYQLRDRSIQNETDNIGNGRDHGTGCQIGEKKNATQFFDVW